MTVEPLPSPTCVVGRYALYDAIASGGMATVHLGRLRGAVGFSRTVAIKRLHQQYSRDPDFVSMFVDEARMAARIRHPNVVQTIDVVAREGELFLVMEYIHGEPVSRLLQLASRQQQRVPHRITATILCGALTGLQAAHETTDEHGCSLQLVHRDVSPQNVLVGLDGLTRVLDFGVALAKGQIHTSQVGKLKGKLAYMSPEQVNGGEIGRPTDIYGAGVIAWEMLVGRRLFRAENPSAILAKVLAGNVPPPSALVPDLPQGYDSVLRKALHVDPAQRYQTAREFAEALEGCAGLESLAVVAEWVDQVAGAELRERSQQVLRVEQSDASDVSELRAMVDDFASGSWPRPSPPALPEAAGPLRLVPDVPSKLPTVPHRLRSRSFAIAGVGAFVALALAVLVLSRPGAAPDPPAPTLPVASPAHLAGTRPAPPPKSPPKRAPGSPASSTVGAPSARDPVSEPEPKARAATELPRATATAPSLPPRPPERASRAPSPKHTRHKSPSLFSGLGDRL